MLKESAELRLQDYTAGARAYHFARKRLDANGHSVLYHRDAYALFLIERGSCYHLVNAQRQLLQAGTLVFIRPSDRHSLRARRETECRLIHVLIDPASIDFLGQRYGSEFGMRFFWSQSPLPSQIQLFDARFERAVNTLNELSSLRGTRVDLEATLLTIMTRVVDRSIEGQEALPSWLAKACQSASQPEILAGGASAFVAAAGRSQEHVIRTSKRYLGRTPTAYINLKRIERAAQLLSQETHRSVEDIASSLGLSNTSYFYHLFRAEYGMTPGKYRKLHATTSLELSGL
jgi:AraC family cel operon transcriptional repressor